MERFKIIGDRIEQLKEERLVRISHAKRNGKGTHSLVRLEKGEGLNEIHAYCVSEGLKYTNHELANVHTEKNIEEDKTTIVVYERIDKHIGRYYEFVVYVGSNGEHVVEELFTRELNK